MDSLQEVVAGFCVSIIDQSLLAFLTRKSARYLEGGPLTHSLAPLC